MTDLSQFVQSSPLIDTHEHLHSEEKYIREGPDVLQHLFDSYMPQDLVAAGATGAQVEALLYKRSMSVADRFGGIEKAWLRCRHTGYGQAVSLAAATLYGMEEITVAGIEAAESRNAELRRPGQRKRILQQFANLDHVQIDAFGMPVADASGPEFFLYDLNWMDMSNGKVDPAVVHQRSGVSVKDLATLREAIVAIFARYAPLAIAVKTQHAYVRTLQFRTRADADAEAVLTKSLAGKELSMDERLCLGDWCLERCVEQAAQHDLPVKIHTGYYAGNGYMGTAFPMDGIRASGLTPLLAKHPKVRFVLMHIAYPYSDELLAVAKHYANAYVDLCWAWSIAPYEAAEFVRRLIHVVPSHKLMGFGGDTGWPGCSLGYALQARQWLGRALQAEVTDGLLSESEAMALATRFMLGNQRECFNIEKTRAATTAAAARA